MHVCAIDLVLSDGDTSDMDVCPFGILASGLTNTTASIKTSHARFDAHAHELVMVVRGKGLTDGHFIVEEGTKMEFLVPSKLEVRRDQFVIARSKLFLEGSFSAW